MYEHFDNLPTDADVIRHTSRRRFMATVASGLLGVNFLPRTNLFAAAPTLIGSGKGTAKRVIYLSMKGAMSQFETLGPKPGTEGQGPTEAIETNVTGIKLGQHLPKLAQQMDKLAIINSMMTETGVHEVAEYTLHTGYRPIASTSHPSLGPWIHRLSGRDNPILPASVTIGTGSGYPGAGYLGSEFTPVPVGTAKQGLQNIKPPGYLSEAQFNHRMELVNQFDRGYQRRVKNKAVQDYTELYDEAIRLMRSQDLQAFDINLEPKEIRAAYGNNNFGQGCLLARRLAQGGVKFVEVGLGGWDDHRRLLNSLPKRAQMLDQGMSALLADLKSRGMLDETLVVLGTEFGRQPEINMNQGRDHQPGAFSCALAGGGIAGGRVYGETDDKGRTVEDDPVTIGDFNATIAFALGIDPAREIDSPDDRPFSMGNGGEPVEALFA